VLSNILRNALNYSQGSQIDIIQQKNSLIIADNGIGISLPNDVKVQELSDSQLSLKAKAMELVCNWYKALQTIRMASRVV